MKTEEPGNDFLKVKAMLIEAFKTLPDEVTIPYEMTPEGQRRTGFKRVCPPEFYKKINRDQLRNVEAFDRVAQWNGEYPGPLAFGTTGCSKSRAAWSALGRLCVREGRTFAWFTTKRLAEMYFEYHMDGDPDRLWRVISRLDILFVDDLDKLEMNDRNSTMIFEFYDWVYREHRPVITTTNRDREWWSNKMGEAFCRRLFDEAHYPVSF